MADLERWSASLPTLSLVDIVVPAQALWAPANDQFFRMFAWVNGRAQERGRPPSDAEMAEAFAGARRDAVSIFRHTMHRTRLEIVTSPGPARDTPFQVAGYNASVVS